MYIPRNIDKELMLWKHETKRKPLIVRGARQVGKSSTIRYLGADFRYFIELNFDEQKELKSIFEQSTSIQDICEKIAIYTGIPIIAGETLLFLDEIQTCIPAITALRYFYEKMPDLHVIAAGSLLEFVLADIPSYGVGRVRSIFLYPFAFSEFLVAIGEAPLAALIQKANAQVPMVSILHTKTIKYLKFFFIIGGMPEAVATYVATKDLLKVQNVLNDLVLSIQEDFVKYHKKIAKNTIREVFESVVRQVGYKFTYSYPNSTLNNTQIKEILNLLEMAGLIHAVTHTAANGIPPGASINIKQRKFLLFDTGIFQRILGLNIGQLLIHDDFHVINKGNIAELHVGLELLKQQPFYEKSALYFWQREARNSQAEVDYVVQMNEDIIPLEVKAGSKGAMQSMFLFLEEKQSKYGFRLSLENFSRLSNIEIVPLYAVSNILSVGNPNE